MPMKQRLTLVRLFTPRLGAGFRQRGKRLLLGLLLIFGYGGAASAEGLAVSCARNSGYYQFFDTATIEIGKDSAVGDVLGPWINSYNATAWNCTPNSAYQQPVQFSVQGYPPYTTRNTIVVDGQTYMLYNTTVKAGLGYIVRWRYTLNGKTTNWQPLTIGTGGQQTHPESITVNYSGNRFYLGVDAQVRFVKTTTGLTAGAIPLFDPIYLRHLQTYNGIALPGDLTYMIAQFKSGGTIASGGTCTTPNVNVDLPEASVGQFNGVGSVAGRKAFELAFNQCPAGLASIGYSFAATTQVLDAANGVVAPNATSSASGVGIQLLRGNNLPVTFGTIYLLDNYNSSAKANYRVPMQAGLFQVGNAVTAGTANTAITFTLNYK
ncbi:fimbrial protein [Serratia fonticola]|uniref:fimbrial protein n=1 Tax=Serratia fonticola TaxID=47917 RepID=UPI000E0F412B|nr:fimbrial protein [Serratia fonticola]RDL17157.1 major type 1 subunit fimbrin (pilin) [Serratia fonticola]